MPFIPLINKVMKQLCNGSCYSFAGIVAAYRTAFAFRLELYFTVVIIPLAFVVGHSAIEYAILLFSWLLILIIELLNTAVEIAIDRISLEKNELSKHAKDVASAAVFLACLNAAIVWGILIFG